MSTATHEVFNQSTPLADVNLWRANRPLQDALRFHAPGLEMTALDTLGADAGSAAMQQHARLANLHKPVLKSHDRFGRRVDQVEFHPSYHALLGRAMAQGLHGTPWSAGADTPHAHVARAAGFMLFTEAEPSVLCPVSMSYAVTPSLRANAALLADWAPQIAGTAYDPRFVPWRDKPAVTMGMGMTEKQGGSDVRANTTRAEFDADDAWGRRHAITGHKWFFSAPMCDAFLVLAQTAGGLSCFFMPRLLPDGSVNAIRIQRLKDKLGNHANASSEVEFERATAWLVGEEGRGVPQILAMGALTRLDCALGTAGLMRQALSLALHHTRQRRAFGKVLADQPLMRNVLADLALESEAATSLALRLARAVQAGEGSGEGAGEGSGTAGADDPAHEALMRRVLTPIAKFWVCKRGSAFAQEAMECLGGNGYVEEAGEGTMARIYREMPLNSIWEGAGNIQALDLLRALRSGAAAPGSAHSPVADALQREFAPVRGAHAALDRLAAQVTARLSDAPAEEQARALARDVALLMQAVLLRRHASDAVFEAFCAARLQQPAEVFGQLPAGLDLQGILERALPHDLA